MDQSEPNVIVFLIGNKKDMEDKREVSLDRVEAFKRERGIQFSFETSAKTGENIESLFITASKILYHNFKDKIAQMVSLLIPFLISIIFIAFRRKMRPLKNGRIRKLKISTNYQRTLLNQSKLIRRRKRGAASENFGESC
jgi:hypothetical protein|tara:strand:+ start:262 stop:681 length:420 start_codon:yes stop_codon:yes gene_type:complete